MFYLAIGMYLVTFDLIKKKKIGAGANFGEGGPEKQLFLPWPKLLLLDVDSWNGQMNC